MNIIQKLGKNRYRWNGMTRFADTVYALKARPPPRRDTKRCGHALTRPSLSA